MSYSLDREKECCARSLIDELFRTLTVFAPCRYAVPGGAFAREVARDRVRPAS